MSRLRDTSVEGELKRVPALDHFTKHNDKSHTADLSDELRLFTNPVVNFSAFSQAVLFHFS